MFVTLLLAFSVGLLLYAGVPVALAHAYPIGIRKKIGDVYFWLAMHSFRRLNVLRKQLSGYSLYPFSIDSSKNTGTYTTDEEQHIQDPMNTLGRIYGKPVSVQYEESTAAVNASMADWGEAWHEHVREGKAVEQREVARDDDGNAITTEAVNPFFEVGKGSRLVDPANAHHLMVGDTDPDDAAKAEAYTEKSQEGFRSNVNAVEVVSLLIGFVGSYGTVVGVEKYILEGTAESGGGGGGVPAPPIPMGGAGIIQPAGDAVLTILGAMPVIHP